MVHHKTKIWYLGGWLGIKRSIQPCARSENKISQILFLLSRISYNYFDFSIVTKQLVLFVINFLITERFDGGSGINAQPHYSDVIMGAMASQITSLTIVYSTVYSGAHQRHHQRSSSLAFVRGIHRWSVNSPHKRLVTRNMFSFDDVIMKSVVQWFNFKRIARINMLPSPPNNIMMT